MWAIYLPLLYVNIAVRQRAIPIIHLPALEAICAHSCRNHLVTVHLVKHSWVLSDFTSRRMNEYYVVCLYLELGYVGCLHAVQTATRHVALFCCQSQVWATMAVFIHFIKLELLFLHNHVFMHILKHKLALKHSSRDAVFTNSTHLQLFDPRMRSTVVWKRGLVYMYLYCVSGCCL